MFHVCGGRGQAAARTSGGRWARQGIHKCVSACATSCACRAPGRAREGQAAPCARHRRHTSCIQQVHMGSYRSDGEYVLCAKRVCVFNASCGARLPTIGRAAWIVSLFNFPVGLFMFGCQMAMISGCGRARANIKVERDPRGRCCVSGLPSSPPPPVQFWPDRGRVHAHAPPCWLLAMRAAGTSRCTPDTAKDATCSRGVAARHALQRTTCRETALRSWPAAFASWT